MESNKKRYDVHTSPGVLLPGDYVLVTNLRPQGKTKQKDQWEDIPYLVTGRVGDLPVYVVQQEGTKMKRTLHHNLLLLYHDPHKTLHTTVSTGTDPAPSTHSRSHPVTIRPANVDSNGGHKELEPTVVITLVLCPFSLLLEKNNL